MYTLGSTCVSWIIEMDKRDRFIAFKFYILNMNRTHTAVWFVVVQIELYDIHLALFEPTYESLVRIPKTTKISSDEPLANAIQM